jgi:hypothetical protein
LFISYGGYFVIGRLTGKFESVHDFKLHYFSDPTDFYLIGRLFSALMGALSVGVVYLLGKQLHSKKAGGLAAAFFSVEFLNFRYAHIAKPDATMIFLLVVSLYFANRVAQEGKLRDYLLAGLAGGLAISTKYNALFVIPALAAAHLVFNQGNFFQRIKTNFHFLVLGEIFVVLFFFVGTPFALVDLKTFFRDLEFVKLVVTRGDAGENYFSILAFYVRQLFLPLPFTWYANFLGLTALLGFFYALYRRDRRDWVLLSFVILHFVYFTQKTSSSLVKPHYLLPLLPVMYVFAGKFIVEMADKLAARFSQIKFEYVLAGFLLVGPFYRTIMFNYERTQKTTGHAAREWVENNLPPHTKILQVGFYDLALRENKESILRNAQNPVREADRYPKSVDLKIEAAQKYSGNLYNLGFLNPGWNVTAETIAALDEMPLGVRLPQAEELRPRYWQELGFEYAIVIADKYDDQPFSEMVDPKFRDFTETLDANNELLQEFKPSAEQGGWWIRIYKFGHSLTEKRSD